MQRYVLKRCLQGLVAVFLLFFVVFVVSRILGDPTALMLPDDATIEEIEALRRRLGLDQPYYEQFFIYLGNILKGDLGKSLRFNMPVTEMFFIRFPRSLGLIASALIFALVTALPLGVWSATNRDRPVDIVSKVIATLGVATPNFWLGIMLIAIFGVRLGVLPVAGMGSSLHYIMPAFTLGTALMAGITRLLRSSMLEVLDSEYVKLARIKGVSERSIIWVHCLKNSITAVLSFAGVYIATLFGGAIVTETVFAWPGVGRMLYIGIIQRDYPIVQGVLILKGTFIVFLNLGVDILYAYVDPRIRYR